MDDKRNAPTRLILLRVLDDTLHGLSDSLYDSVNTNNYSFYRKHNPVTENIFRIYHLLESNRWNTADALGEIKGNSDEVYNDVLMRYFVELDKAIEGGKNG
jgi:hypothetical protein